MWILFELFAQPAYMNVHDLGFAFILCSPHAGHQLICGNNVSSFQCQSVKEVEFMRWQVYGLAAESDRVCGWVNSQIAYHQGRRLCRRGQALRSPQHSFNSSQEYIQIKRFSDIVICSQLQSKHLVKLASPCGEEDDGHAHVLSKVAQGIQAIHAGQPNIQEDEVRWGLASHCQCVFRIRGSAYGETGLLKTKSQTPAQKCVIIY